MFSLISQLLRRRRRGTVKSVSVAHALMMVFVLKTQKQYRNPSTQKAKLDPAAHGRGPRRGRNKPLLPSPRPSATLGASIADPGQRCPGLRLARARQNTMVSPRGSTDLTKAAVRRKIFLTGIVSTCGFRTGVPNLRALASAASPQPFSRGA